MYTLTNLYLVAVLTTIAICQNVNETCVILSNKKSGTCAFGTDCPEVDRLTTQGIHVQLCGFHLNLIPIFCCQNVVFSPPPTTTTVSSGPKKCARAAPTVNEERAKTYSEELCADYSKIFMTTTASGPLIENPEITSNTESKCPKNFINLISNGKKASLKEFPYMAALGVKSNDAPIKWQCGGTLITDRFVLTAAHCLISNPLNNFVRLGDLNLADDNDKSEHKDYTFTEQFIHENYCPPAIYHDIALIKLTEIVTFTEFIRPACLWTKPSTEIQNKLIAAGWGHITFGETRGSDDLLKVELNLYSRDTCSPRYAPQDTGRFPDKFPVGVIPSMLCVGDLNSISDTCEGDSGGPLINTNKSNPCIEYVVGITSAGTACGNTGSVAIYTEVLSHLGWIVKKISE